METEDSDPKVSNIEGAGEEEKSGTADPTAGAAAAAESADDPEHAAAAGLVLGDYAAAQGPQQRCAPSAVRRGASCTCCISSSTQK